MSTTIPEIIQNNGGYATMKQLKEAGIHTRKVRVALEDGIVTKIKPGLYKLVSYPRDEYESFVDIYMANSSAIICLSSALAYHELTTFNPSKITVAVPNNTDSFELDYPPMDVYFYRENIYETGIEEVERSYGSFKVYNKPKTVCDMFHYRNKVGEDLAFEGLRNYLNLPEANVNKLQKYMKICRVKTVMKPYLKALLSS